MLAELPPPCRKRDIPIALRGVLEPSLYDRFPSLDEIATGASAGNRRGHGDDGRCCAQALKRRLSPIIWRSMGTRAEQAGRDVAPRRADARRNRDLILKAAEAAFALSGVNASLDEIARSASVGPGTLYRHFPTREHLLCEVLHERQAALLSGREEASAMPSAENALRAWMVALKDYLSAFTGLPQPFIDAFEAKTSPLALTCRTLVAITDEFLSRAQAEGSARPSVSAPALFLSALGSAFVHDKAGEFGTTPELIEEILAFGYLARGTTADTPRPPCSRKKSGPVHD
ncbi:TetR/AcrR family transcriptional regulator [Brevundimonas guildfordensis]|uniref:Helix-turn-helix transcriptional regulator n=1 Tax=Brevundimonas guildfordensis TaxID=2762241 RepID=A0ABR8QX19_9CAUL|nr:TetR/AcrR family transcriptional regulator [Brevundimonas guildfordensis]MBD7939972.1 helix-turn-helix transcriptional regulator [Brevundimonas guildfordensis]